MKSWNSAAVGRLAISPRSKVRLGDLGREAIWPSSEVRHPQGGLRVLTEAISHEFLGEPVTGIRNPAFAEHNDFVDFDWLFNDYPFETDPTRTYCRMGSRMKMD